MVREYFQDIKYFLVFVASFNALCKVKYYFYREYTSRYINVLKCFSYFYEFATAGYVIFGVATVQVIKTCLIKYINEIRLISVLGQDYKGNDQLASKVICPCKISFNLYYTS